MRWGGGGTGGVGRVPKCQNENKKDKSELSCVTHESGPAGGFYLFIAGLWVMNLSTQFCASTRTNKAKAEYRLRVPIPTRSGNLEVLPKWCQSPSKPIHQQSGWTLADVNGRAERVWAGADAK